MSIAALTLIAVGWAIFAVIVYWQDLVNALAERLTALARRRAPDFTIRRDDGPYLERWWVIPRNRFFNLYLHRFSDDDEDRALHDHPWFNCSLLLRGAYFEHVIRPGGVHVRTRYSTGAMRFRAPWGAHRVELDVRPTWTLFITGPVMRAWGFHCPKGWRHWKEFVDARDHGSVGKGCAE